MKEFFDKAMAWIKGNTILAVIGAAVITFLFFPKILKLGSAPLRRRRTLATRGRSYGMRRKYGTPRRSYKRGGKAKKPWQVKGSLAARRHMALIRRRRRA